MPTLSVQKMAGPLDLSLINAAIRSIGRPSKTIKTKVKIRSKIRFTIGLQVFSARILHVLYIQVYVFTIQLSSSSITDPWLDGPIHLTALPYTEALLRFYREKTTLSKYG